LVVFWCFCTLYAQRTIRMTCPLKFELLQ
jgi:hypothetical protein